MKNKALIISSLVFLLLGFGSGYYIAKNDDKKGDTIPLPPSSFTEKIDTLITKGDSVKEVIQGKKDSVVVIKTERIKELQKIDTLPLNNLLVKFKEEIENYEKTNN